MKLYDHLTYFPIIQEFYSWLFKIQVLALIMQYLIIEFNSLHLINLIYHNLIQFEFIVSIFLNFLHFLLIFTHNFMLHVKKFIFKLSVLHVIGSNCLHWHGIFNLLSWTYFSFLFNNFFFNYRSFLSNWNILHNLLDRHLLDIN